MGTVYNRGTRTNPNWYVAYKDAHGKRRAVASRQPTKALARKYLEQIEARIADGLVGILEPAKETPCGELMEQWLDSLRNRNAQDDRSRTRRHVLPEFAESRVSEIKLPTVMTWIDRQRATSGLAEPSIRHNLNLLSRFFSWAIERGLAEYNPVRQVPMGKRPKPSAKKHIPWLDDDALVREIIRALPERVGYMFYIGNRSGMRTGEIAGLRMSDLGFLDEGVIRVRYSYDGPLKEDKDESGKTKWVPAAHGCAQFLGPWLERRRADGAAAEDYVFPGPRKRTRPITKAYLERHWRKAVTPLGVELTWYQATRHSFTSRLLAAGVPLDEVSDALGHSSPLVTRRYYDHFIRRSYSSQMRAGLDLGPVEPETRDTDKPTRDE